jgi:hypothetical protein
MATIGKKLWQKLSAACEDSREDKAAGQKLFKEFTRHGYIHLSPAEKVILSSGAVFDFYRRLSLVRTASSPVVRRRDDRWLRDGDFQFINLQEYGSFFRVLMDIPRLRNDCLIFYPATDCDSSRPLHPRSHSQLDRNLSDPFLDSLGLTLEQQFRLLVAAAHLCGKKAGYYLSPLIDPVSAVIYRKPEFFLWKTISGRSVDKATLIAEVNTLVQTEYERSGVYDYGRLKEQAASADLAVSDTDAEDGAVCFDFDETGALSYFSRIFGGLQMQFALDFVYLALPHDFSDDLIQRVYSAIKEAEGCKRFTGYALELSEKQNYPEEPTEPVVLTNREKDRFPLDEESIHTWFHQLGNLFEKNKGRHVPVTQGILLAKSKNTDDSDLLRSLFLSRFSGVTLFRRPLVLQRDLTEMQNRMEDIFQRYRVVLEKGELLRVVADETFAWWIINEKGRLLIPVMALNNPENKKPGKVKIDYSSITGKNGILSVVDYDFSSSQGSLFLSADSTLTVTDLKPGSVRLFSLQ